MRQLLPPQLKTVLGTSYLEFNPEKVTLLIAKWSRGRHDRINYHVQKTQRSIKMRDNHSAMHRET